MINAFLLSLSWSTMAQVIYQDQYQKFNYALVKKLVFNTNEAHSLQSIVGYNGD